MVSEMKYFVAGVAFISLLICQGNAWPVSRFDETSALQRVVRRLMADPDTQTQLLASRWERGMNDLDSFDRSRRGSSSNPLRGVALVPIDSLRRQFEEELERKKQEMQDADNQKIFNRHG